VPPIGANMTCSLTVVPSSAGDTSIVDFIGIKTCIDTALTLLGEMRAMAKKLAVAEETKRTDPPDVWPPSPQSNGGSHMWEWSNTCRALAATSVIALIVALPSGSHDPSLRVPNEK
jgi:hypothetical protein